MVLFVVKEKINMKEPLIIKCPKCEEIVGKYYGKSERDVVSRCNTCRKQVIFNPIAQKTLIRPLPDRASGSGIRF